MVALLDIVKQLAHGLRASLQSRLRRKDSHEAMGQVLLLVLRRDLLVSHTVLARRM